MNKQSPFVFPFSAFPQSKIGEQLRTNMSTLQRTKRAFLSKRALTLVQSFLAKFISCSRLNGVNPTTSRHLLLGKLECSILSGSKRVLFIPYYNSLDDFSKKQDTAPIVSDNNRIVSEQDLEMEMNKLGLAFSRFVSGPNAGNVHVKEVELRLIELRYPYLDSSILAQYVAMNRNKYNFTRMHKRIFKKASSLRLLSTGRKRESVLPLDALPGHITGLKMELAGRLTTQRSIPRKTVSNKHTGSFHVEHGSLSTNISKVTNQSQYGAKNKLGAHTIKV